MHLDLKLLDHINLNGRLSANFACEYSEDGKIFILSENGAFILTLKGYVESIFSRFSFRKDLINLSDTSLCENLDIDVSAFLQDLSPQNMHELILDVNLSGNKLNNCSEIETKPMYAMWSPRGIVQKTDCALAVLTNLYDIEIYVKTIDENEIVNFVCVVNYSKCASDHFRRSWKRVETFNHETKLQELKKRAHFLTPTTFTWSHVVLKDRRAGCILFIGHRDGAISAWRFVERKSNDTNESKLEFLERYQTNLKCITALHWFCQKSDAGGLSVGDSDGRICALSVSKLSTDKIKFSDKVVFNQECDLKVDKLTIITYQNITYLIVVKMNYLLIYAINEYGDVLQGKLLQIGNLYITGILHYEKNTILVLSLCGQLKQLTLDIVNNEIVTDEKSIKLDIDTNKYRTHGLLFSPNKVFLAILAYPCHLKDVTKGRSFINFFIFQNNLKNPFDILMTMPTNTIRDYWDCFETLRVLCIQEKRFPWLGIDPNLNYDSLCLVKLKILRLIAKMSEKLYTLIPHIEEYNIKAYNLLNYIVDIKLATQRMTKLLNFYFSEKRLSLFQLQSLDLLNFFLKEMIAMDILTKANLGNNFIDEIYDVMRIANEIDYPPPPQCVWCGEKIIGTSCVPYHPDSRCSLSLMPIKTTPGYKCPFCKCVVNKEMDKEYFPIFCPYCDIPMEQRYNDKKFNKKESSEQSKLISVDTIITELDDVVLSDCSVDCLKDTTVANIEDNSVEYIVLTDSEDEENCLETEEFYNKIKSFIRTSNENNERIEEFPLTRTAQQENDDVLGNTDENPLEDCDMEEEF